MLRYARRFMKNLSRNSRKASYPPWTGQFEPSSNLSFVLLQNALRKGLKMKKKDAKKSSKRAGWIRPSSLAINNSRSISPRKGYRFQPSNPPELDGLYRRSPEQMMVLH